MLTVSLIKRRFCLHGRHPKIDLTNFGCIYPHQGRNLSITGGVSYARPKGRGESRARRTFQSSDHYLFSKKGGGRKKISDIPFSTNLPKF